MFTLTSASARSAVCFAALAAVLAVPVAPRHAAAAAAPTTPTFMLSWGVPGISGGQFAGPAAVAVDAFGNVYVADTGNHRVQKFDVQGHFLLSWGGFGNAPSKFNNPTGIAVDVSGNIYVVDQGNFKVKEYTNTGSLLHQWGSPGTGSGQFTGAVGIAVDNAGNFYVSDAADRIQKFSSNGTFVLQWGTTGSGAGQLSAPAGLATDDQGNVYVADQGNHRVQKFNGTGAFLAQWGSIGSGAGQLDQPHGVAVDALGNVYVAELGNDRIQKFAADGTSLTRWGFLGNNVGTFDQPSGVSVDAAGNVFVADAANARVQKFSGAGVPNFLAAPAFSLNIGSSGSGDGQFNTPTAVATDAAGGVFVTDAINCRVQKFSGLGVYSLRFGTSGSAPGQLFGPSGIALDPFGNVFVTNLDNRIAKFTVAGAYVTQWGSAGAGAGQFSNPYGIAVDPSGNVYVADTNNHRVQKFSNTGTFLAQWGSVGTGDGQFTAPRGVAADRAGNIYVTDNTARVQKFTSSGTFLAQWTFAPAPLNAFSAVAVDALGDVYVTNAGPSASVEKYTPEGTPVAQWGSYGTGSGQFAPPWGLSVDATGNVNVADNGGARVVKFTTPPALKYVADVGNDQGRQVRLTFKGASQDAPSNGGITSYAIYRRVEPLLGASSSTPAAPSSADLAGWDYVGSQPAAGDAEYSMVVPTLADANPSSTWYSAYLVRALAADGITHFDSFADYGYSIDNLSPPAPSPVAAAYAGSATHLHWGVSGAADFATFRLYKGGIADFSPAPATLLAATTDTGYVDAGPAGNWYKVSAVDFNGNESPYAAFQHLETTAVGPQPSAVFALDGVRPNPAVGRTLNVSFSLPAARRARLELLDVMGRLVASADVGAMGAGGHVVDLAAGRPLAPGLYLVRLTQGGEARTARVVVTR